MSKKKSQRKIIKSSKNIARQQITNERSKISNEKVKDLNNKFYYKKVYMKRKKQNIDIWKEANLIKQRKFEKLTRKKFQIYK